jgi:hypothetical protein
VGDSSNQLQTVEMVHSKCPLGHRYCNRCRQCHWEITKNAEMGYAKLVVTAMFH